MSQELLSQEEATSFLQSFDQKPPTTPNPLSLAETFEQDLLSRNKSLIKKLDDQMVEMLETGALPFKDLVSAKESAFKQVRTLEGNGDELDTTKLIPTNLNIQIINN